MNIILGSSTHGEQMRQARGSRRARTELLRAWTRTEATWRLERPVIAQGPRGMSTQGGGCGVAQKASESILRPIYSCPYQHHLVPRPHSPSPGPSCPVGWATGIKSGFHLGHRRRGAELLSTSPSPDPSFDTSLLQVCTARGTCPRETDPCQPPQEHPRGVTQSRLGHVCQLFAGLRIKGEGD